MAFDSIDRQILGLLQEDGRMTNVDLAVAVSMRLHGASRETTHALAERGLGIPRRSLP